ncbi:hypothetical protein QUF76_07460 [Desulfobacterales bacterium HSG16]|nr:hypothetical protein [Desulfobacterales bacterium HSG16]
MSSEWTMKGGTFSHKNAQKEYGLTEDDIFEGIDSGKLQYRKNYVHGNPYYRLLRSEVEAYVLEKYGENHMDTKKNKNELKKINSELRKLKSREKVLLKRKKELTEILGK